MITVLDGYPLNPGDLSWGRLAGLGPCSIYDRSSPEQIVSRARDARIVLSNKVLLNAEIIECLPKLRYIGVLATGYNNVDLSAARRRGIVVSNVPEYATDSIAQFVFAHILNLANVLWRNVQLAQTGNWSRSGDWCIWDGSPFELSGTTLGLLGYGNIARATARIARAFRMRILTCTRTLARVQDDDVQVVDLETLFREADILSLHCPLTPETEKIVNSRSLRWMKPQALLINVARGGLVDEMALYEALEQGTIAGAGLDVLTLEPPPEDHPLLRAKSCVVTPHMAWVTRASRQRLLDIAIDNVVAFLAGRPQNVVS